MPKYRPIYDSDAESVYCRRPTKLKFYTEKQKTIHYGYKDLSFLIDKDKSELHTSGTRITALQT